LVRENPVFVGSVNRPCFIPDRLNFRSDNFTISKPREKSLVSFNHRKKDSQINSIDKLKLIEFKLSEEKDDLEEFSKGNLNFKLGFAGFGSKNAFW
jgi:hypothetical protein